MNSLPLPSLLLLPKQVYVEIESEFPQTFAPPIADAANHADNFRHHDINRSRSGYLDSFVVLWSLSLLLFHRNLKPAKLHLWPFDFLRLETLLRSDNHMHGNIQKSHDKQCSVNNDAHYLHTRFFLLFKK